MTTAPKPRLPRYSLRTMFVVVTMLACWLGWQVNIVHQRKALLRSVKQEGGWSMGYLDSYEERGIRTNMFPPQHRLPAWRLWLGDKSICHIAFRDESMRKEADRARELFPEAEVWPPRQPD